MSFFKTFVLFIILLAAVFYVYKMEYIGGQRAEEAKKQAKKIFNFKKDDVFLLRIHGGGEDLKIEKQDGAWRIISPIEAEADDEKVEDLISYVSEAEFEETISVTEDQLDGFGLGASAMTIDFYTSAGPDGKPHRLKIGDYSPTMHKVYIKTSIAESVLTAKSIFKNRILKTMSQLRKKQLLPGDTAK